MARLTASFALSAVLLLATGICSGNGQSCLRGRGPNVQLDLIPSRIISKATTTSGGSLSIAAGKDDAVLARSDCSDDRQLWFKKLQTKDEFLLLNLDINIQLRAMKIPDPEDPSSKVKFAPYNPLNPAVDPSMRWKQGTQDADGFSKIQSVGNTSLFLDGLLFKGPLKHGTDVGAIADVHNNTNVLWKIEAFPFAN